jgi:hypothetical protein
MKKGVLIALITGGVILLLIVGFFILTNKGGDTSPEQNANANANSTQMVDCGQITNPSCFSNRMSSCLPVTAKMIATDGTTTIEMTVLGLENNTCHFQRKLNNVLNLDCYFPSGALSWDLIDQSFGNDKGLQSIIDNSCTNV